MNQSSQIKFCMVLDVSRKESYPQAYDAALILDTEDDWEYRCTVLQYGSTSILQISTGDSQFFDLVKNFRIFSG